MSLLEQKNSGQITLSPNVSPYETLLHDYRSENDYRHPNNRSS